MYGVSGQGYSAIAAYLNQVSTLQESKKCKVTKAIFCAYDIFSKQDVRVEVTYPGGTQAYSLSECAISATVDWANT